MLSSNVKLGSGFIDSHCHIDQLDNPAKLITNAIEQDVQRFLVPATCSDQWQQLIALKSDRVAIGLGTHPWFVVNAEQEEAALKHQIAKTKIAAIGEIGLDFYQSEKKPRPNRALQIESFSRQLAIAAGCGLPVIVHSVRAHAIVLELLKKYGVTRGVIHAFVGSKEQARAFVKQGFSLGVGSAILRSKKSQSAFFDAPIEHILLETDAPYMRADLAKENPLLALLTVAEKLADIKQTPLNSIRQQTTINAQQLFF